MVGAVFAPVAGLAVDKFGPRRVIVTAFPLFSLGIAACATANALWQLYVFYIQEGYAKALKKSSPMIAWSVSSYFSMGAL